MKQVSPMRRARRARDVIANYRYHFIQKGRAKRILRRVESAKGRTHPKLVKTSNEYARDVLGWVGYAPWLHVYCSVANEFRNGWIPDNYYRLVVIPAIKGDYDGLSYLRSLGPKMFGYELLPDVGYCVNGLFLSRAYDVLDQANITDSLFKQSDRIVFKLDNSLQGRDIFILDRRSFDVDRLRSLGNGTFQNYIAQHPFFREFMPDSVATLRITTVMASDGEVSFRAGYLRFGRANETNVKSASHIRVPFNERGVLDAQAYMANWLTTDRHPDTGVPFAGRIIPHCDKCVSAALQLQRLVPHARCVGWDMIVDQDSEVKLMEWNSSHNDVKFAEASQGPCFSDLGWERLWLTPRPPRKSQGHWAFRTRD